jgi:hypothetical protein
MTVTRWQKMIHKINKKTNFTALFEPNLMPKHCTAHIERSQKTHADRNWHQEHPKRTKTHRDMTRTRWQKMIQKNKPNLISKHCITQSNLVRKHMLVGINIKSTPSGQKLTKIWLKHGNAASVHAWENYLIVGRGVDNALICIGATYFTKLGYNTILATPTAFL